MDKYFEDQNFEARLEFDLSNENFEFHNCSFSRVELPEILCKHSQFIECRFIGCNFSNAKFNFCSLVDAEFRDCKLLGVDWTLLNRANRLSFHQCFLDYGVFNGMDLNGVVFENCSLKHADFSEGNFNKSRFTGSNLAEANFNNSKLESCDLSDCKNYVIDIKATRLKGTTVSFPEALSLLELQGIKIKL